MGNKTEFQKAVKLVLDHVSFDKPNTGKPWFKEFWFWLFRIGQIMKSSVFDFESIQYEGTAIFGITDLLHKRLDFGPNVKY